MSKITTESFIKKAVEIHGNKYDYSKVNYNSAKEKVIIICKEHGEFLQSPDSHKRNKGCKQCSIINSHNKQKSNTKDFIQKAIKIHGNKFDYSKVEYRTAIKKIIIICKEHGEFLQVPAEHLSNKGCKQCGIISSSNAKKSNTEDFIKKAILIHKDKYDYSKVDYINNIKKIIIICKLHGEFLQSPAKHLNSKGCTKCSGSCKNIDTIFFIEQAKKIHDNKYDYSKVNYKNAKTDITIICKIHGEYIQKPNNHINCKQGCSKCSNSCKNITTEYFIEKAKSIHNDKYNYSKIEYINCDTKVIIICKEHGGFLQIPDKHINSKLIL
jgi:hypothetical protein